MHFRCIWQKTCIVSNYNISMKGKSHRTLKNSNTAFQIYLFIFLSVFAFVRYSWFYIQVLILSPASCLYDSPLLFTINSTALQMLAVFANRKQLYNQSAVGYDCEITLKIHNIRLPVFAFQLKSDAYVNYFFLSYFDISLWPIVSSV